MTGAALLGTFSITQGWPLPALWKQYRFVSEGGVVLVPKPAADAKPLRGWALVFIVFVLLALTALVTGASFVSVMLLARVRSWQAWAIAGAVNVGLWLYVVHCWRRVLFQKAEAVQTANYGEPEEGVWPPPPTQTHFTQTKNAPRQQ